MSARRMQFEIVGNSTGMKERLAFLSEESEREIAKRVEYAIGSAICAELNIRPTSVSVHGGFDNRAKK